ncbi:MAG: hypothetical protein QNL92_04215 [Octadecabacter sp.]
MSRWPAIHTTVGGQRHLTALIYAGLLTLMLIVVPVIGFLIAVVTSPFVDELNNNILLSQLYIVGIFVGFSPMFSWADLLLGVPLSILAMSRGMAGWGVVAGGGTLAGALTGAVLGSVIFMAAFGAGFGLLYWIFLRWLAPAAVIAENTPVRN